MSLIYKIFRPLEWQDLQEKGIFTGSADDVRDGFIHFSYKGQLEGTLTKFFASDDRVVIAAVPSDGLLALREENGFPHLYDSLATAQISAHWHLMRGSTGRFDLSVLEEGGAS